MSINLFILNSIWTAIANLGGLKELGKKFF
jgi:hypothetical protein